MPTVISNSTFLDAFGAGLYDSSSGVYQTLAAATLTPAHSQAQTAAQQVLLDLFQYGPTPANPVENAGSNVSVMVGLVLDRAAPESQLNALLSGNWGQRQASLAQLSSSSTLWSTYGADPGAYGTIQSQLTTLLGASAVGVAGYVSSPQDRTIWLTLDPNQFYTLFNTTLLKISNPNPNPNAPNVIAWTGNLALNDAISASAIKGVWIDRSIAITNPAQMTHTQDAPQPGPLGIGNDAAASLVAATPAAIAAGYNFPLPAGVATDPVALIESNYGTFSQLQGAYQQYRQAVGLPSASLVAVSGATVGGSAIDAELTLDISVVAGAVPKSTVLMYSDFGTTPFNAYQQIFFDAINHPSVVSSSLSASGQHTRGSPFEWAFKQLMIDGVLANVSVHMAAGDQGASAAIANGIANVAGDHSSPYALLVGGTSISPLSAALADPSLNGTAGPAIQNMVQLALQNDPSTVFPMVAAGLKALPSHLSPSVPGPQGAATQLTKMFETVWQALVVTPDQTMPGVLDVPLGSNKTGSGGVSHVTDPPSYQKAFGLGYGGRAMPDVSALASGNTMYAKLNSDYVGSTGDVPLITPDGGTSAASPLWASLTTQFNAIFHDQGLPNLGYYNDLLYIAGVVAPGAFNDIQVGNNVNGFYTPSYTTGYYNSPLGLFEVSTGHGYFAQPGYDLTSGLGSPNGLLLARALTAIAHQQVSFGTSPPLLGGDGHDGWVASTDESLLIQTFSHDGDATVGLHVGNGTSSLASGATASFAWTARFAQQSLQSDFDPALVLLFDKQAQGSVGYTKVAANQSIGVTIDGVTGQAVQASLSNPFGFADFFAGGDAVHVARPVALAETVGGANGDLTVVRMRQGGENSLQLTFYKVDDYNGTIEGLQPGQAAYAAAAQGRAYQTTNGLTGITGPGYGQFGEVALQGVHAGDIVAMRLDNLTTGTFFWAFASANEKVAGQSIGHIWNFGLNTWGWEDTYGGGDHDFNDMVVQLDFTSAHGHAWLMR